MQAIGRKRIVADEIDFADAGLVALVDLEHEIDAAVGQRDEPIGHLGLVAAELRRRP